MITQCPSCKHYCCQRKLCHQGTSGNHTKMWKGSILLFSHVEGAVEEIDYDLWTSSSAPFTCLLHEVYKQKLYMQGR